MVHDLERGEAVEIEIVLPTTEHVLEYRHDPAYHPAANEMNVHCAGETLEWRSMRIKNANLDSISMMEQLQGVGICFADGQSLEETQARG